MILTSSINCLQSFSFLLVGCASILFIISLSYCPYNGIYDSFFGIQFGIFFCLGLIFCLPFTEHYLVIWVQISYESDDNVTLGSIYLVNLSPFLVFFSMCSHNPFCNWVYWIVCLLSMLPVENTFLQPSSLPFNLLLSLDFNWYLKYLLLVCP